MTIQDKNNGDLHAWGFIAKDFRDSCIARCNKVLRVFSEICEGVKVFPSSRIFIPGASISVRRRHNDGAGPFSVETINTRRFFCETQF